MWAALKKINRMYEATGKIKLISDTQNFPSGFSKREFVVTTGDGKYPQDLKFEVVKDKCELLDKYKEGQDVLVNFDIRGNEYNGKYYVNLSCWKLNAAGSGGGGGGSTSKEYSQESSSSPEPSPSDLRNDDDFDDDIPF